tara:strand:+ start:5446 stop:5826 length:381 start_codon:yes stop_codon:yes gene_type:complete
MRIIPADDINLLELDTVAAIVRLVPFEEEYIPHFMLMSKSDVDVGDDVALAELASLQEGLYQAANKIDEMIRFLLDKMRHDKIKEFQNIAEKMHNLEFDIGMLDYIDDEEDDESIDEYDSDEDGTL